MSVKTIFASCFLRFDFLFLALHFSFLSFFFFFLGVKGLKQVSNDCLNGGDRGKRASAGGRAFAMKTATC